MTLPTTINPAILETVLGHLAPHFLAGANGDVPTARHAAGCMLAAYDIETEAELHLAAEIVSFSLHALEALGQAMAPDLSLNKVLRLRGNAVSLSREAHKAQRKLDQLRRVSLRPSPHVSDAPMPAVTMPQATAPASCPVTADKPGSIQTPAQDTNTRSATPPNWTLSRQQRQAAARFSENLRRNQAEQKQHAASIAAIPQETAHLHGAM